MYGEEHPGIAFALNNLGETLREQGAYAEAETMLQTNFETFKQTLGLDHRNTQRVVETLVTLYTAWGKPEQAALYQAMLTEEAQ